MAGYILQGKKKAPKKKKKAKAKKKGGLMGKAKRAISKRKAYLDSL